MTGAAVRRAGWLVVLVGGLGLSACRDNGLRPEMNRPLDQAVNAETAGYRVYDPSPENRPISIEGRAYIGSASVERIPPRMMEPAGTVDGVTLYRLRGSEAPHPRLYADAGNGEWRPYLRLN